MRINNILKLIIAIVVCEVIGIGGAFFTSPAVSSTWYTSLEKPFLQPPSWIFSPVWIMLYALMGIAAFLIWRMGWERKDVRAALGIFGVQLFLNAIWSIIFFGLKNPGVAFVEIIFLWLAIVGTIIVFYKISRPAAFLLLPYILWVSFAGYLNYSIWTLNQETPVACTMDAKLCPDGSYVGRVPPKCDFTPCPKEDLIVVESPKAYEEISSPLLIKGRARGFWFFEASFPIKLFDDNNNLIAIAIAQADGEWMIEDFVGFKAEIIITKKPTTQKGKLILEKDNPSGLPENADSIEIPVIFPQFKEINLYYYNSELDRDENNNVLCSRQGLAAVKRAIPITQTPIQDAINLLLMGKLAFEEQNQGITTEYPLEGLSLKGALLKDGVLTLEFDDSKNRTVGGACRVGILWFQIEATAKQVPEVKQVRFLPEEIFQP